MTRTQARYWATVATIVGLVLSALSLCSSLSGTVDDVIIPAPTSVTVTSSPTVTSLPSIVTGTPSATATVSSPAPVVVSSRPTRIVVPSIGLDVRVSTDICRVLDGMINPQVMAEACYYTAPDKPYQLPGSTTADLSVLFGHTWRKGTAAFNTLYDWRTQQFRVKAGDELWLQTEKSGELWLVYQLAGTYTPDKGDGPNSLMNSPDVWGAAGQTKPDTLLTIGCLQPDDLAQRSSKNIVVEWKFYGVRA